MSFEQRRGWFSRVNGLPVKKQPLTISHTSWVRGKPFGILWHYTAGCSNDIAATLEAKNFGASFNVGRDGSIHQYTSVLLPSWHAYEASRYYIGIEHTTKGPGSDCLLTDEQLKASAALSAALVEYAKRKWGVTIPVVKLDPPVTLAQLGNRMGFFDHTDGPNALEAGGEDRTWNKKGHTDRLYRWSWDEYLAEVETHLAPPQISVTATKGEQKRERAFDTLKQAWAWGKELLLHGWRVSYRKPQG